MISLFQTFQNEPAHSRPLSEKVGVLMVNLGTPKSLSYWDLRRYLSEFLSDRRVVESCPFYWIPLLQGVLLQIIPFKSRKKYQTIWNQRHKQSPLARITQQQAHALSDELAHIYGDDVSVTYAYRYGAPSIKNQLRELKERGCSKILILPLYPQYASATTGSVLDAVFAACRQMRWVPSLRTVDPYYIESIYTNLIANSISEKLKETKTKPDAYVFSYHGMPLSYVEKGDPYPNQCEATTKRVAEILALPAKDVVHCYQSRFGKGQWLTPATDETLMQLPEHGKKNICIITPGFAADCVETLEEIVQEGKETFIHAGGQTFTYVPCLNASERGILLLTSLVRKHMVGWAEPRT